MSDSEGRLQRRQLGLHYKCQHLQAPHPKHHVTHARQALGWLFVSAYGVIDDVEDHSTVLGVISQTAIHSLFRACHMVLGDGMPAGIGIGWVDLL